MELRVLVVEDDQLCLELIGQIVAAADIDVLGLRDAWEAAAIIEKEKFDGIFLDLTMPGLDGLELARRIRASAHNRTTPIVVVSGRTERATMKEAFAAGAHFFLSKPLDSAKVRNLLNTTYGSMLRERRRNRRVPLCVEIACRAESGSFTGMTAEIGEESLVFRLEESLHPGELLRLTFRLPNSRSPIEASGIVIRTDKEHRIGCQFRRLGDMESQAVKDFVSGTVCADGAVVI
jgi:two-component system chemotaxis response regulator CheY